MRLICTLSLVFFSLLLSAATLPPGFVETALAAGLDPTAMAQAPDGRIFITEKYGAVRIVENGTLLPDPFLLLPVDNHNERGLSGIAFHPDFAQNGYVYLYYTVPSAGHNRLIRVRAQGNFAVPGSEEVLLETDPMAGSIHNAGAMAFGPDGNLYLAVGEGADGPKAPSLNSLLGKVLRLHADGTIPQDNPFYQQATGVYRAIYATGLRNPFSLAIQPGTGRIFAGDVGSNFFEEINDILPGADYGWNLLEGNRSNQPTPPNYRNPLYAYPHTFGCAVVGGAFYNPPVAPFPANYTGKFFFGDYCTGKIHRLNPATGQYEGVFADGINRPLAIMTGSDGALYYIARGGIGGGSEVDNTSSGTGVLWRVEYVGQGAPVFSVQPANVLIPEGENATFTAQANGSPNIAYQWQRDGQDIPGATDKALTISAAMLPDSGAVLRCVAQNPFGKVNSTGAVLRVTANQRPLPVILAPVAGHAYAAGDTIWFSGMATDPETGAVDADDLTWRLDLHHNDHAHPGLGPIHGTTGGYYAVPRFGETDDNVWLRISLTARDPIGLTQTVFRDIFPKKTTLRIESKPSGLAVRVDGKTYTTPVEIPSVQGMLRQVQAQPAFQNGNTLTAFVQWADGNTDPNRSLFAAAAPTTLVAQYENIALRGTGIYGMYFPLLPDTTFGEMVFARVDSMVNFNWEQAGPARRMPGDYFGVRWLGYIEPTFSEQHFFHLDSDDGFRFWVDGQLIAEAWKAKSSSEVNASIFLEKGKRYPIRLDYFEYTGGASAKLSWSGASIPKAVIPQERLFPRLPDNPGLVSDHFRVQLRPNPVGHLLRLSFEADFRETFDLRVYDAAGRLVREWRRQEVTLVGEQLTWPVSDLHAGMYWAEIERQGGVREVLPFVKI
ncbi:MAG: PQQ-dependent sugar dehydrogenase [Lewinellaceae bacterium]|nr:PQQ-dependent sugar dehydrogenase [Lewinellaceae bacterium]